MAIKPLEKQHTGEQDLELFQNNIKDFVKVLEDNPLLDGTLIEDVEFGGAVTVNIAHKLGRKPRGWILTDLTVGARIVIRDDWDDKFLTLTSNGACTISLWVF